MSPAVEAPAGRVFDALAGARSMAHGEQLARTARKEPDRPAFVCREQTRTFGEVNDRVNRLAQGLGGLGLQRGDRLALLMGNSIEMVEAIFAGWRLGAIVVPINFRLTAHEVAFALGDSGAKVLIADSSLAGPLASLRGELRDLATVVVLGEDGSVAGPGSRRFDELVAGGADHAPHVHVGEHDAALIMYTSGTTGRPKGAVLSHFNLLMSTLSAMITQAIGADDEVWYANLPLFHIGGLSGILPYVITGGCSIIVPSTGFDAADAVQDLVRHGVTGCVFVGLQWDSICDHMEPVAAKLRLRRATWGAANTPVEVLEKIARTIPGVPVLSFFGQTEMSPVTCVLRSEDADRKRGSVGRPMVNVEARLVDEKDEDVLRGEVGEIVYRGPTVMQGYWQMPRETDEALRGGWFHSGDLCRMDEDGYIYVVDRKTDMIISGGENVYCPEVEAALRSHPGVADVAVVGVAHPRWGESPRAIVVPRDAGEPPDEHELIAWCKEHLASYKKPTSVVIVDQLPLNAAGKVLKNVLRERYGSEQH